MSPVSHVAHPAQVNQFFRIVNGKKSTRWNNVVNGHNFDSENCMAAEGAVAASAQTDLRSVYSPNRIRAAQSDLIGGIGVDDVDDAFRELGIGSLSHPANFDRDDVLQALVDRRHVAIAVDYRKVPTADKLQLPGLFDHALGLDDVDDHVGMVLRYDSLGIAPIWVPYSAVFPAAEALALRERGNKNALFAGVTKQRAALPTGVWKASVQRDADDVGLHRFGRYFVKGGVVTGSQVPVPRTGGFSAACTPPAIYRWPGHTSQRLVRLLTGSRGDEKLGRGNGWYIRSAYAERVA